MAEQSTLKKLLVGKNWKLTLLRGVILASIIYLIQSQVFIPFRTTGVSMEPTLPNGKLIFVSALAYRKSKPQRGDIVVIRLAGRKVSLVKRIVGLPGEKLTMKNGILYLNGEQQNEAYISNKGDLNIKEQSIGENEYFIIGDNRLLPPRNMVFGKVQKHRIIGKY